MLSVPSVGKNQADTVRNRSDNTWAIKITKSSSLIAETIFMNIPQARAELQKLGFIFPANCRCMDGTLRWGTQQPEAVKLPPTHTAKSRSVFFAKCNGGFYVSSSMQVQHGPKVFQRHSTKNIFGGGKTLRSAINQFKRNFKSKTYNA